MMNPMAKPMMKSIVKKFGIIFLLSLNTILAWAGEPCLLTQEQMENLQVLSLEEVQKDPNLLIFRGIVYDMAKVNSFVASSHAGDFKRIKDNQASVISEAQVKSHRNKKLMIFLKNPTNAVGMLEGTQPAVEEQEKAQPSLVGSTGGVWLDSCSLQ